MTALELFKKAGLEDYLQSGAIGAGLGAAGMGAASYIGGAGKKDRGTNALKDALKGALLGGTAGAGVQGVKDLGSSIFGDSQPIQALKDQAAAGGQTLDVRPHSQAHPLEYAASKVTGTPFGAAGATAGGAGAILLEKLKRNSGKRLFNTVGPDTNDFAKGYLGKQRDTGALSEMKGVGPVRRTLTSMLGNTASAKTKALEELIKNNPALRSNLAPGVTSLGQTANGLFPTAQVLPNTQSAESLKALMTASKNTSGPMGGLLNKAVGYGKKGLIGAGVGGGTQIATDSILNAVINAKNSPEQLQLWDELSNK